MSKYGGSEKTTQAFVAAYNKPRLSTPLKPRRPPASSAQGGRILFLTPPRPSLSSLVSSRPESDVGWGYWEDSPCWMLQDPRHHSGPSQGCCTAFFRHLLPQQIELSVPFDPHPPHLLHKNSMQFYGVHRLPCPFFFSTSFLAANHRDRIRLFKGW